MIIFTGASYWKVHGSPGEITSDFKLIIGHKWIKSKKAFAKASQVFPCPKHYQKLTDEEAKQQGLV